MNYEKLRSTATPLASGGSKKSFSGHQTYFWFWQGNLLKGLENALSELRIRFFMTKNIYHKDGFIDSEATPKVALLSIKPFFSFEVVEVTSEGDYK